MSIMAATRLQDKKSIRKKIQQTKSDKVEEIDILTSKFSAIKLKTRGLGGKNSFYGSFDSDQLPGFQFEYLSEPETQLPLNGRDSLVTPDPWQGFPFFQSPQFVTDSPITRPLVKDQAYVESNSSRSNLSPPWSIQSSSTESPRIETNSWKNVASGTPQFYQASQTIDPSSGSLSKLAYYSDQSACATPSTQDSENLWTEQACSNNSGQDVCGLTALQRLKMRRDRMKTQTPSNNVNVINHTTLMTNGGQEVQQQQSSSASLWDAYNFVTEQEYQNGGSNENESFLESSTTYEDLRLSPLISDDLLEEYAADFLKSPITKQFEQTCVDSAIQIGFSSCATSARLHASDKQKSSNTIKSESDITQRTKRSSYAKWLREASNSFLFDPTSMSAADFCQTQKTFENATGGDISIQIFCLLKNLGAHIDDPVESKILLSQMAGLLHTILSTQAARGWEMREWKDPNSGCGVLATAVNARSEQAVRLLLMTGICGITVPHCPANSSSVLESPELLAQCALNACGSIAASITDSGQPTTTLSLTVEQRLFRLLLEHVSEVDRADQREQILNFRKSPTECESPTILHRLIEAHSKFRDHTWSIEQLILAGANPRLKAIVHNCGTPNMMRLSCLQQAACSKDYLRLIPILLQKLDLESPTVQCELQERFYCGNRLISITDILDNYKS